VQQNKLWVSILSVLVVGGLLLFIIPKAARDRGNLASSGESGVSGSFATTTTPPLLPCTDAALSPTVGRSGVAAGTATVTLLLASHVKGTNSSTGSCDLSGAPKTQFGNVLVSGTGIAEFVGVGPSATRLTYANRGKIITLKPGAVASVTVGIETAVNFVPPSRCHRANVSAVRLIFIRGETFVYRLRATQVCTRLASTTTSGIVLGTRYP
jgi:hypothetical protein